MLTKLILASLCLFGSSQLTEGSGFLVPKSEQKIVWENNQTVNIPHKQTESLGVELKAESAMVIDSQSGKVLFEKNSSINMPMASLTKMMTAVVVLESSVDLEDSTVIDSEAVKIEGADINLENGEEMRVGDLLHGLLISSGNDAAMALAKKVGGDVDGFVVMMNDKADELGLSNTNFTNPSGLDQPDHYSNVKDLVILANYAFKNPVFNKIIRMKEHDIQAINVDKSHHLTNTNKLLKADYANVKGGKTGYTEEAGFCLATFAANKKDNHIISVVLGDELNGNQFQDSKALVEWTYNNYSWE